MNDKACMKVLKGFGHLVDDESNVYVFEDILGNDIVEICLHKLKYQVHVLIIVRPQGIV